MKEIARLALSVLLILVESTTAQENAIGSTTSSQELINRSQSNLQQLHILFRHGDRAPVRRMFDNSTPIELLWPIGIGQLTNLGVKQEFNLGRWFREQYNSFVPEKYNASDIYVRSTDTDRSLMSGQAFLAGLYRCTDPKHCPLVPAGIFWRPVPIHTVPLPEEFLSHRYSPKRHFFCTGTNIMQHATSVSVRSSQLCFICVRQHIFKARSEVRAAL
ncbi:unnamed protein product [Calicophoron daubneyi]|uniref:acid phosphatase n=1 Tax=Calicophoron daubneyi TaxID=300641 RepID=A0AAV2T137_CALDB